MNHPTLTNTRPGEEVLFIGGEHMRHLAGRARLVRMESEGYAHLVSTQFATSGTKFAAPTDLLVCIEGTEPIRGR